MNELTFLSVFGWFRDFNAQEKANLQAFMRLTGYLEGANGDHNPAYAGDKGWKLKQGGGFISGTTHPAGGGCSITKLPAIGWFQIEGDSWKDQGFCGKPVSKENQVEWFIKIAKQSTAVYMPNATNKSTKSNYWNKAGISNTNAYEDILKGNFAYAIAKTRGRWKSFANSNGRRIPIKTTAGMIDKLISFGARYSPEPKAGEVA